MATIKHDLWSPDACVGSAIEIGQFECSQMVCTKTLYNYIDFGFLLVKNADLPMKLRRNIKPTMVKNHKKKLGKNIEERLCHINKRNQ